MKVVSRVASLESRSGHFGLAESELTMELLVYHRKVGCQVAPVAVRDPVAEWKAAAKEQ